MAKPQVLELKDGDRERLEKILKKGTVQAREARRALKADGETVNAIAEKVGLSRDTVLRCLKKYKSGGLERALHDDHRSGCPASRQRKLVGLQACPQYTRMSKRNGL